MSKITEKIKPQTDEPTFWHSDEPIDETPLKKKTTKEIQSARPVDAVKDVVSENIAAGDKGKLYKIDFVGKKEIEFDRDSLPKPLGWDITDGDYVKDNSAVELPRMQALKELKNFKLVFLIASLVITALVVLLFAVIASKA